ncbi:MAG: hypothetical protein HY263_01135 [Chloroflexi bacterium]|nr:hypothetical protein [Chloroflexota bacterium]
MSEDPDPSRPAEPAELAPDGARPWVERIGLALVAVVMAVVFGGMAAAAWIGGEVFLAAMAGIGALMTIWAAVANLRRG